MARPLGDLNWSLILGSFAFLATLCLVGLAELAAAQQATLLPGTALAPIVQSAPAGSDELRVCNPLRLQADKSLTFKQRFCFYGTQFITPTFALQAGLLATVPQLGRTHRDGMEEWPRRFGSYYARHAAQNAGEMVVGYFHHEDPRWHQSNGQGFVRRTGAALLSVVAAKDVDQDRSRMVLAPLGGALSSGMVSMLTSQRNASLEGGLERAGFVYSTYFIKAVFREYRPELTSYTHRLLHHSKD